MKQAHFEKSPQYYSEKMEKSIQVLGFGFLLFFFLTVGSAVTGDTDHSHFSVFSNTILVFAEGVRNRQYVTMTLCNGNYISTYPESPSELIP